MRLLYCVTCKRETQHTFSVLEFYRCSICFNLTVFKEGEKNNETTLDKNNSRDNMRGGS